MGQLPLTATRLNFNPRSLTGATLNLLAMLLNTLLFQSTLPHGSDIPIPWPSSSHFAFQSTLPHGSDRNGCNGVFVCSISIHAPSRERLSFEILSSRSIKFQSTLPHGSDSSCLGSLPNSAHFNPRSLTGATPEFLGSHSSMIFQSTLPHGSDVVSSQNATD